MKKPANPCTGVCKIDKASGWCRGCWRTRSEIKGWKKLSTPARAQVLEAVALRRAGRADDPKANDASAASDRTRMASSHPPSTPVPADALPEAAMAPSPAAAGRRLRHRKSGRLYTELHRGAMKADGTPVVVYRGDDGRVWVRPASQFDDGRFRPVSD